MRLLLDENISYRCLKYLDKHYPGSSHVTNIKKGRITDREIWDYAKLHNYVIATYDEDFYEWQQLRGFPPFILWLRFGNASTRFIADKLIRHKKDILRMISDESKGVLEIY
ncbi:MAG: hypothetical protein GVY20_11170 [Bacteroidetes bacterium]|jgi:predicted nuclease of predicted toxin-antitoxin system|nr:hypothetical protein [Bacteroidota bacterium]